jgi:hypothetical protein
MKFSLKSEPRGLFLLGKNILVFGESFLEIWSLSQSKRIEKK